jgi:exosome complex RNA-binding protein Rrp4
MSKKKPKFGDVWVNQTTLGKQFGLSAVAIGKKLKELGLRSEDGKPTDRALSEEYCKSTPLKDGTPFFMWHKQKVAELMQASGHQKLDPQEVKARELADAWVRVNKQFQEAVYGIEEEMCIEESKEIEKEAKRRGLTDRVNEILRDRKFEGKLIS